MMGNDESPNQYGKRVERKFKKWFYCKVYKYFTCRVTSRRINSRLVMLM